jgi:hypothetical protein
LAFGVVFGALTEERSMGIAIGLSLGLALGTAAAKWKG